jgi:hypothetical protein
MLTLRVWRGAEELAQSAMKLDLATLVSGAPFMADFLATRVGARLVLTSSAHAWAAPIEIDLDTWKPLTAAAHGPQSADCTTAPIAGEAAAIRSGTVSAAGCPTASGATGGMGAECVSTTMHSSAVEAAATVAILAAAATVPLQATVRLQAASRGPQTNDIISTASVIISDPLADVLPALSIVRPVGAINVESLYPPQAAVARESSAEIVIGADGQLQSGRKRKSTALDNTNGEPTAATYVSSSSGAKRIRSPQELSKENQEPPQETRSRGKQPEETPRKEKPPEEKPPQGPALAAIFGSDDARASSLPDEIASLAHPPSLAHPGGSLMPPAYAALGMTRKRRHDEGRHQTSTTATGAVLNVTLNNTASRPSFAAASGGDAPLDSWAAAKKRRVDESGRAVSLFEDDPSQSTRDEPDRPALKPPAVKPPALKPPTLKPPTLKPPTASSCGSLAFDPACDEEGRAWDAVSNGFATWTCAAEHPRAEPRCDKGDQDTTTVDASGCVARPNNVAHDMKDDARPGGADRAAPIEVEDDDVGAAERHAMLWRERDRLTGVVSARWEWFRLKSQGRAVSVDVIVDQDAATPLHPATTLDLATPLDPVLTPHIILSRTKPATTARDSKHSGDGGNVAAGSRHPVGGTVGDHPQICVLVVARREDGECERAAMDLLKAALPHQWLALSCAGSIIPLRVQFCDSSNSVRIHPCARCDHCTRASIAS